MKKRVSARKEISEKELDAVSGGFAFSFRNLPFFKWGMKEIPVAQNLPTQQMPGTIGTTELDGMPGMQGGFEVSELPDSQRKGPKGPKLI